MDIEGIPFNSLSLSQPPIRDPRSTFLFPVNELYEKDLLIKDAILIS